MSRFSEREKQLIFILIALAIFAVTFKFGYSDFVAKAATIEEENAVLSNTLAEIETKIQTKQGWTKDMEKLRNDYKELTDTYGVGNTPEKTMLFFADVETITNVDIISASFGETYKVAIPEDENTYKNEIYCTPVTVSYQGSYESLKKMLDLFTNCEERMSVETINASYEEGSGKLSGSFVLNMYAITGTDRVYQEPQISDIPLGTSKPFGID